jgi:lysophospholipase L1-like esterase
MEKRFMGNWVTLQSAALLLSVSVTMFAAMPEPERLAAEIEQFAQDDVQNHWPEDAILATGSSSMRLWSVGQLMEGQLAPLTVINRGFGGSVLNDLDFYLDNLVLKYSPRAVMIYEGDNDIAFGISAAAVLKSIARVIQRVHGQDQRVRFYILSVKPSISRWSHWPAMRALNVELQALCDTDKRLVYIDVASPMLATTGKPLAEIYSPDGLHMNHLGYQLWRDAVRPVLLKGEGEFERSQAGPR